MISVLSCLMLLGREGGINAWEGVTSRKAVWSNRIERQIACILSKTCILTFQDCSVCWEVVRLTRPSVGVCSDLWSFEEGASTEPTYLLKSPPCSCLPFWPLPLLFYLWSAPGVLRLDSLSFENNVVPPNVKCLVLSMADANNFQ